MCVDGVLWQGRGGFGCCFLDSTPVYSGFLVVLTLASSVSLSMEMRSTRHEWALGTALFLPRNV